LPALSLAASQPHEASGVLGRRESGLRIPPCWALSTPGSLAGWLCLCKRELKAQVALRASVPYLGGLELAFELISWEPVGWRGGEQGRKERKRSNCFRRASLRTPEHTLVIICLCIPTHASVHSQRRPLVREYMCTIAMPAVQTACTKQSERLTWVFAQSPKVAHTSLVSRVGAFRSSYFPAWSSQNGERSRARSVLGVRGPGSPSQTRAAAVALATAWLWRLRSPAPAFRDELCGNERSKSACAKDANYS
jgi:hypothetical protein